MSDVDDFFSSGPATPAISWKNATKGTRVSGVISSMRKTQRTKLGRPGEPAQPMFFDGPDGKPDTSAPIYQLEVTLAETGLADFKGTSAAFRQKAAEAGQVDDGSRRVFVNGGNKKETTTQGAMYRALLAAGATKPEVGGTLTFEVTGTQESTLGGADIKHFRAEYAKATSETLAKVTPASTGPALSEPEDEGFSDEPPF